MLLKRPTRFFILILLTALVLGLSNPPTASRAQSGLTDEELEFLEFIQTAVTTFYEQESYTYEVEQTKNTETELNDRPFSSNIAELIVGETILDPDGTIAAAHIAAAIDGGILVVGEPMLYEVIIVDGETYARFDLGLGPSSSFPERWTNIAEANQSEIGLRIFENIGDYAHTHMPVRAFEAGNFSSIVELAGDEIDGQAMRVFELTWNRLALAQKGYFGIGFGIVTQALSPLAPPPALPPANGNDSFTVERLGSLFEDSIFTQRIWIGADDGLPHRVELNFDIDGEYESLDSNVAFEQDTETTINFTAFNTNPTIEAPID